MKAIAELKRSTLALLVAETGGIVETIKALKAALPADSPKQTDLLLVEGRMNDANKQRLRGTLTNEQLQAIYNQLREELIAFIQGLEADDLDPARTADQQPPAPEHPQGTVLYQIPETMQVGLEKKCVVRLAFDEEQVIQDITLTGSTEIRDIRISEVMRVDLLDTNSKAAFAIRGINSPEQFIAEDTYTEWVFFVEPLRVGTFPITLKIAVIELINGKERLRELVLEERIDVTAEASRVAPRITTPAAGSKAGFRSAGSLTLASGGGGGAALVDTLETIIMPPPFQPAPAPDIREKRTSGSWLKNTAYGLIGLVAMSTAAYAAVPAEVDFAVASLRNSPVAYQKYIDKYEGSSKTRHLEKAYFNYATESKRVDAYKDYIERYPVGKGKREWAETASWVIADKEDQPARYLDYVRQFPESEQAEQAAYRYAIKRGTPQSYLLYLNRFGKDEQNRQVILDSVAAKEKIFLEQVRQEPSPGDINTFLKLYRDSENAEAIKRILDEEVERPSVGERVIEGRESTRISRSEPIERDPVFRDLIDREKLLSRDPQLSPELQTWNRLLQNPDREKLKAFLEKYPDSKYARRAQSMLDSLR